MRPALCVAVLIVLVSALTAACAEPYVSVWEDQAATQITTPSWFGTTGLILTPTAETLAPSEVSADWHGINRDEGNTNLFGLAVGVTPEVELGGSFVDPEDGDSELIGNVKVRIPICRWFDEPNWPDLAFGAIDISDQLNRELYFVFSKNYYVGDDPASRYRIGVSLGIGDNRADEGSLDGLFGGIEFGILKHGLLQAEYDGNDFNVAARYLTGKRFSLDVGLLGGDFGWGASYNSGF